MSKLMALTLAAALQIALIPPAQAQVVAAPISQTAPFDLAARRAIVAELAKIMRDEYVDRGLGARAADKIERNLAAGDYDKLQSPAVFSIRLNADLAEIAH